MSRKIILKAAVLCASAASLALAACKATDTGGGAAGVSAPRAASTPAQKGSQQQQPASAASAARVSIPELQAMMERGEVVVVDVRSKASYDAGHIKGAILIPDSEVGARAGELPRDKKIVTYCA